MTTDQEIHDFIENEVKNNKVVLFMKGTKLMPQCGFSGQVVEILRRTEADFITHNVLESDRLREGIKQYSNWPTIPQLYVNGEFIGGCDIVTELYDTEQLQDILTT